MNAHMHKKADEKEFDVRGPTPERILKSQGDFVVGGARRGTSIYHFQDTPLTRLYKRFAAADKSDDGRKQLTVEYVALMKYRNHWHCAGLEPSVGSIDFDRVHSSDPLSSSGMAKSEAQAHHRAMYRQAGAHLEKRMGSINAHKVVVLLDNFVCYEWHSRIASALSPYLFRKSVRDAAACLAEAWGIA